MEEVNSSGLKSADGTQAERGRARRGAGERSGAGHDHWRPYAPASPSAGYIYIDSCVRNLSVLNS